ncbi:hypothetical protein LZ32DRAFT_135598 [Colletotrichum eremochloae]|nr:hypothetical protein LZ32DRAFT_135598 [Colletotrichum eremochloae]
MITSDRWRFQTGTLLNRENACPLIGTPACRPPGLYEAVPSSSITAVAEKMMRRGC